MVNVEPFIFQKVTAFKERLQMVDKINEIVEAVNTSLLSPDEIRQMIENELSDYYDKVEIDQMFSTIDFSPYYTKTEVNTIVDRIDGDVDAVEDRLDTAEGDIDALETSKQDVLTAGTNIDITNNVISLGEWEPVPLSEWANLFEVNGNLYTAKDTFMVELYGKGMESDDVGYLHTSLNFMKGVVYNQYVSLPPIPYLIVGSRTGILVADFKLAFISTNAERSPLGQPYEYELQNYSSPNRLYYFFAYQNGVRTLPVGVKKGDSIDFTSTSNIQVIIYRRK